MVGWLVGWFGWLEMQIAKPPARPLPRGMKPRAILLSRYFVLLTGDTLHHSISAVKGEFDFFAKFLLQPEDLLSH